MTFQIHHEWKSSSELALPLVASLWVVYLMVTPSEACAIAPSNLTATDAFATEIYLTWHNNSIYSNNLNIQRSQDNVVFSTIVSVTPATTSYTDTNIAASTKYYYRVTCQNSVSSNVASAQTTIALVTDPYAVFSEPSVSKPAYLTSWKDPVFNTQITRIGESPAYFFVTNNDGNGIWSKDARHNYQLFQPWSIDGSLYVLENRTDDGGVNGGSGGGWLYLSGSTYQPTLGPPSNDPASGGDERWNPNPQYATQLVMAGRSYPQLWWFDVINNVATRRWSLPFTPLWLGNTKGHVSRDGRFVVLIDTTLSKMAVVDMDPQPPYSPYPNQRIGPVYNVEQTISGISYGDITVAVDPSGKYAVLHYGSQNGAGGDYLRVYDINPSTLAMSVHLMPPNVVQCTGNASDNWIYSVGHHDLSLNPYDNNEPVAIGQEDCGNIRETVPGVTTVNSNGIGHVVMVRLRDGAVTSLTDPGNYSGTPLEAYAHHISAQNQSLPGWVFVSYGPWPGEQAYRYYDEVIAVSMDGKQRVQRLAHLHSDFENDTNNNCANTDSDFNYRSESHGVPSPNGKRLAFASNWLINGKGTGSCSIQDYIIDLR
jgi:hypothetical protein